MRIRKGKLYVNLIERLRIALDRYICHGKSINRYLNNRQTAMPKSAKTGNKVTFSVEVMEMKNHYFVKHLFYRAQEDINSLG